MSEPPIEPPDGDKFCTGCGEPIQKRWTVNKYSAECACSGDDYLEDWD